MNKRIEYRVCQVQRARISYVNGEWQGNRPPAADRVDESLQSCSFEWDYLRSAGEDGWRLAGIAQGIGADSNARILYLMRERDGG
ncbi:MAG: hypothetical protein P4L92_23485 [Rudaea sp.]|nr:hypothetical protein [Rudaea sp.]